MRSISAFALFSGLLLFGSTASNLALGADGLTFTSGPGNFAPVNDGGLASVPRKAGVDGVGKSGAASQSGKSENKDAEVDVDEDATGESCISAQDRKAAFLKARDEMTGEINNMYVASSDAPTELKISITQNERALLALQFGGGLMQDNETCFKTKENFEEKLDEAKKKIMTQEQSVFEKLKQTRNLAVITCEDRLQGKDSCSGSSSSKLPTREEYVSARKSIRDVISDGGNIDDKKQMLSFLKNEDCESSCKPYLARLQENDQPLQRESVLDKGQRPKSNRNISSDNNESDDREI